ncbi:MAG: hypothetical protein R3360_02515 [Alphaproteobacteria bacterium]|nr:hypothetical protein [Alphaproteobacteria bacterium]
MKANWLAVAVAGVLLGACSSPTKNLVASHIDSATPERFTYCSGYGCSQEWIMVLTPQEWQQATAVFDPAAETAEEERQRMAQAIAIIEQITGKKAGTENDKPGAAILVLDSKGQLDCIDESHNTMLYLTFFEREGLLRFHTVGEPAHRGDVINRWFHNTATVVEEETGQGYVIDTWFGANGEPADITTVEVWLEGWEPEHFKTRPDR